MEKEPRRLVFGAIPIVFLLILPLLFVDFFWGNVIPYDQCNSSSFFGFFCSIFLNLSIYLLIKLYVSKLMAGIQYFSGSATANSRFEDQQKSFDHLLARLVRGKSSHHAFYTLDYIYNLRHNLMQICEQEKIEESLKLLVLHVILLFILLCVLQINL